MGQGTAAGDGNDATVSPKAGLPTVFMIVACRVMDATRRPGRVVQGRVVVKVLDR